MARLAVRDQLVRDAGHRARRNREADADVAAVAARAGLDLARDADDLAGGVEERAAAVAVVDGGVGLYRVLDRPPVGRRDRAVKRADDARGDGVVEAERVSDGDDRVADLDRVGVTEGQ